MATEPFSPKINCVGKFVFRFQILLYIDSELYGLRNEELRFLYFITILLL